MEYRSKESFYKTGLKVTIAGLFSILIGYMTVPKVWFQSVYPSDMYWPIAIGTISVGLILTGLIIIIIGMLREN